MVNSLRFPSRKNHYWIDFEIFVSNQYNKKHRI